MDLRTFFKIFSTTLTLGCGAFLLNSCSSSNPSPSAGGMVEGPGNAPTTSSSFASTAVCTENAFLQKYQCSFVRIEQAARAGEPDAQYALGYLYYYGIGTTQDQQTGLIWIRRAAAQGQPVARNALKIISTTKTSSSLHTVSNTHSNMSTVPANTENASGDSSSTATPATPDQPISNYLPNYGQGRVNTTETPTVDLSTPQ